MQVEILHDNIIYRSVKSYAKSSYQNFKIPNCGEPTETSHTTQKLFVRFLGLSRLELFNVYSEEKDNLNNFSDYLLCMF